VKATCRREAVTATAVGVVAFLPFLGGVLSGASLYFRDLALHFLPLRRMALEGLRSGHVPFWNPYLHEGVPLSVPAVGYPLDLLQLLRPDERGISLVLALHVPLAAAGFYALARRLLATPRSAAAGGALTYALGGFVLSTVNLYVHLEAAAWAPLVVLALAEIVTSGRARAVAAAGLFVGMALSTTGIEIVVQAIAVGLALGRWPRRGRRARALGGAGAALVLGALLAAPVLVLLASQVVGSVRGRGFETEVVLAHSVHPFSLLQVLVAGLFGNVSHLAAEWWGQNFFPRGFPYVMSLYLGPAALVLSGLGAATRHPLSRRLVIVALVGLVLCLGRWSGLAVLVDAVPGLDAVRYPVKAFFAVHLSLALLVSLGLSSLLGPASRGRWTGLAVSAGGLGGLLSLALLLPHLAPTASGAFAAAFLPPGFDPGGRAAVLSQVLGDAAIGGVAAIAVAAVALLARRGALPPPRAASLVVAVVVADLLRAGTGLNPMVRGDFFRPSPELAAELGFLRQGRVFTCTFDESPAYRQARVARGAAHVPWTFAVALETLTPAFNVPLRVPTALSPDLTMLVPEDRVSSPAEATCRDLDVLLPRLRQAAVHAVVSPDPLVHPALEPRDVLAPGRLAPLRVHLYRLSGSLPRAYAELLDSDAGGARAWIPRRQAATDRLDVRVETSSAALLVVRDGWAPGWRAWVNGAPTAVRPVEGRHRGVEVPAGGGLVIMRYRPPGLLAALGASLLALAVLLGLFRRPRPGRGGGRSPTR
jgi:hypothetical protein